MNDGVDYNSYIEKMKIEKRIKKQPNVFSWITVCPYCGKILSSNERQGQCGCGQLIDWGSVNG